MSTAMKTVPDLVLDTLAGSDVDGNTLSIPAQLDPKAYAAVKKVINTLGGKWVRARNTHVWPDGVDVADLLDPVLLTGTVVDERKQFDAFYTPPDVAEQVIDVAKIEPGMSVLEPSAGNGALALPAARAGGDITAYELRDLSWVEHGLNRDDEPRYDWGPYGDTWIAFWPGVDFLTVTGDRIYDRVIMNPPFSNQQDMRHVRHAADFVAPGGRLVAIMSPSFMFRTTKVASEFRDWLDEHPHDITALPDGSFNVSGTGVRTDLLTVDL